MDHENHKIENRVYRLKKIGHYTPLTVLRHHGCRVVFLVESTANKDHFFQILALDMVKSTLLEKNVFLNEIRLFSSIKHPMLLHYHESFVDVSSALIW